ncbi:hypothetical protein FACS1894166_13650 [Bacilli bacterium]|nr:hypothetical protein FACS1894166_13650 [Bacilli bacterium]
MVPKGTYTIYIIRHSSQDNIATYQYISVPINFKVKTSYPPADTITIIAIALAILSASFTVGFIIINFRNRRLAAKAAKGSSSEPTNYTNVKSVTKTDKVKKDKGKKI